MQYFLFSSKKQLVPAKGGQDMDESSEFTNSVKILPSWELLWLVAVSSSDMRSGLIIEDTIYVHGKGCPLKSMGTAK